MTMRHFALPLVAALLATAPVGAGAQQAPPGPVLRANALEVTVGGRVQTQLNTTSVDSEPPSQLVLRRARIELDVRVNEWITGTIQPEFGGGGVELKDAYLRLTLSPGFGLLAGRAHRPFGLLEQTSSKRMPLVERGLRIRGLAGADQYGFLHRLAYSDRDLGVQVLGAPAGAPLRLAYAAGVFAGPLHGEVGNRDSYQYAARVTASPLPDVRVGAGWSSRDFAGVGAVQELRRGHAFEIDLEYGTFAPGLHVLAELASGAIDPFTDASFRGVHTWIAFRSEPLGPAVHALEPAFRVSHSATRGGPTTMAGGTLVTPGLNLYLTPLNRLMLNYDIWSGEGDARDGRSLKLMLQLAF